MADKDKNEGKRKVDLTHVLKNIDGSEAQSISESEREKCVTCGRPRLNRIEPFTLRLALVNCLTRDAVDPKTQRLVVRTGPEIYQATKLALRIDAAHDTVRLTPEQVVDLKERARLALSGVAMTRVWDLLDPPNPEPEDPGDDN